LVSPRTFIGDPLFLGLDDRDSVLVELLLVYVEILSALPDGLVALSFLEMFKLKLLLKRHLRPVHLPDVFSIITNLLSLLFLNQVVLDLACLIVIHLFDELLLLVREQANYLLLVILLLLVLVISMALDYFSHLLFSHLVLLTVLDELLLRNRLGEVADVLQVLLPLF